MWRIGTVGASDAGVEAVAGLVDPHGSGAMRLCLQNPPVVRVVTRRPRPRAVRPEENLQTQPNATTPRVLVTGGPYATETVRVALTDAERAELLLLIRRGKAPARTVLRAHILLRASEDAHDDDTAASPCTPVPIPLPTPGGAAPRPRPGSGWRGRCATCRAPARRPGSRVSRRRSSSLWPAAMPPRRAWSGRCSSWPTR